MNTGDLLLFKQYFYFNGRIFLLNTAKYRHMEIVAIILWLSHTELVLVNRFMVTLITFSYLFIVLNTFLNCTVMLHIIPLYFRHVYVLCTGNCILCFSTNLNSDFCNCLITTVGPLLWELHHPSNFLSPITKPVSLGQFLLRNHHY